MENPLEVPSLMWVNAPATSDNVVVLTADTLFQATLKRDAWPVLDLGLEDGKPAADLLPAKAWRVSIADITRFEVTHTPVAVHDLMNKDVTIYYRDEAKNLSRKLTLETQAQRDDFLQRLKERVGDWPFVETNESAWRIIAKYLWIMTVLSLLTFMFCWFEVAGVFKNERGFAAKYLDAFGVWGILVPGLAVCVGVLATGIRQLRTPPIIVTYAPPKR